ncbi:MAG: GAF domain-containing protein [Candidatus Zixiibacteriota bacterium]
MLSVAIELINNFSEGYNWTGFYMMRSNVLEVGPYIGPKTEHKKIDLNDGICGAAASEKKTIIVEDVNADPRFLACSVNTRSEIVVPLMDGDKCIGEIDIDSNQPGFFNHQDEKMLQEVASLIVNKLKGIK